MKPKISVAVPDSLLSEASHLRIKSIKVGQIARLCALYEVDHIYIFRDTTGRYSEDGLLMKTLLDFIETPQYLRKRLFTKMPALEYSGLLPPLRTPHHSPVQLLDEIRVGDFREGVVINGGTCVDAGLSEPVPVKTGSRDGARITVRFTGQFPHLRCEEVNKDTTGRYWGYSSRYVGTLQELIKDCRDHLIILTSRKGKRIEIAWENLLKALRERDKVLVVVGSPKKGLLEILDSRTVFGDKGCIVLNLFPDQSVATVRSEEALAAAFAQLNLARLLTQKR